MPDAHSQDKGLRARLANYLKNLLNRLKPGEAWARLVAQLANYLKNLRGWLKSACGFLRARFTWTRVGALLAVLAAIVTLGSFGGDIVDFFDDSSPTSTPTATATATRTPTATVTPTLTPTLITPRPPPTRGPSPSCPTASESTYDSFQTIEDASSFLRITVPSAWCDIDTDSIATGDPAIRAAPDLAALENRAGPGVEFTATGLLDLFDEEQFIDDLIFDPGFFDRIEPFDDPVETLLDVLMSDVRLRRCKYEGRLDYERALYSGRYDRWTNCDGPLSGVVTVAARQGDNSFVVAVVILMASEADRNALDMIFDGWEVLTDAGG